MHRSSSKSKRAVSFYGITQKPAAKNRLGQNSRTIFGKTKALANDSPNRFLKKFSGLEAFPPAEDREEDRPYYMHRLQKLHTNLKTADQEIAQLLQKIQTTTQAIEGLRQQQHWRAQAYPARDKSFDFSIQSALKKHIPKQDQGLKLRAYSVAKLSKFRCK